MFDFSKLRDDQLDRLISLEGDLTQLEDDELQELIESQEGFTDVEAGFQRAGASFKLGIAGLLDSPDLAESARRELEDVQRQYTPDVPSFTDITGPLSGLEYIQEQLVTTVPQLTAQVGAGAIAGRFGGPRAALAGATGVGVPFFAGMNIDRQMEEQNIGFEDAQVAKAYGVGLGQSALDVALLGLVGRTLGTFGATRTAEEIAKAANRSRTQRVASAFGKGAAIEAPTEAGQQALEIIQANPEKFYEFGPEVQAELLEAAVAGGLVGGVISAPTGLPTPKDARPEADLDAHLREEAQVTSEMLSNIENFQGAETPVFESAAGAGLPAVIVRQQGQERGTRSRRERVTEEAQDETPILLPYDKEIENVRQEGIGRVSARQNLPVPIGEINPSTIQVPPGGFRNPKNKLQELIRQEGVGREPVQPIPQTLPVPSDTIEVPEGGFVFRDPTDRITESVRQEGVGRARVDRGVLEGELLPPEPQPVVQQPLGIDQVIDVTPRLPRGTGAIQVPARPSQRFNLVDRLSGLRELREGATEPPSAGAEARIRATRGLDLVDPFNDPTNAQLLKQYQQQLERKQTRAASNTRKKLEKNFVDLGYTAEGVTRAFDRFLESDQLALFSRRTSADTAVKAREEAKDSAFNKTTTDAFNTRALSIFNDLRQELGAINLNDVALRMEGVIPSTPDSVAEGVTEQQASGRVIISLATQIYSPDLSDADLKARLKEVMNHETIHALKNLGLFTDAEYASLVKAAKAQKYVDRSGKERKFTYFERAKALYRDDEGGVALQEEEAVAELFRDWAAGRKKIGGRPQSLFTRIINFFKSLGKTLDQQGFDDVDKIFRQITAGEIGARDRRPISSGEPSQMQSRRATIDAPAFYNATDRQIEQLIDRYDYPYGTTGYAVRMPIEDFMSLVFGVGKVDKASVKRVAKEFLEDMPTNDMSKMSIAPTGPTANRQRDRRRALGLEASDEQFARFDPDKVDNQNYMGIPALKLIKDINIRKIIVDGHEGRHRTALAAIDGADTIPVQVEYKEFYTLYDQERLFGTIPRGQAFDFEGLSAKRDVVQQYAGADFSSVDGESFTATIPKGVPIYFKFKDELSKLIGPKSDPLSEDFSKPKSATELLNTRPNDELGTKKLSKRITLNEWLKRSAVKEPVYHATFTSFSAFDPQVTDDNAIHFAPEQDVGIARLEEVARFQQEKFEDEVIMFPRMIEARIQVEKPLRLPFDLGNWGDDLLWKMAFDEGKFMFKQGQNPSRIKYQIDSNPDIQKAKEAIQKAREQDGVTTFNLEPEDIWMALEGAGFDGIIYTNEGEGFGSESYLVWNSQQIYVEGVEPVQYGDLEYAYTYDDPKDSMTQEEIDAVSYRPIIGMQAPIDQTAIDQGTVRERLEMFKYGVKGSTPLPSPTALQRFDRLGDPLPTIEEVKQEKSLEQMGFASPSEYISYLDRQLDGLMEPEKKFSRRISAPTAESNPFNVNLDRTIIDFYPEEYEKPDGTQGFRLTGDKQYKPNSTLLLDAVKILHGKTSEALGTDRPVEYTEENKESLARLMATEALKPLDTDTNAIGWYDEQIKNAKKILRLIDPRIFESDKNETIYDWALAVTSNGTLVEDNFAFAQEVFDFYIKNQRLPVKEWKKGGKRNGAMRKAFQFANEYEKLVNDGQVRGSFREFLSTEFSVKELQKVIRELNQEFNLNMSVPADENADTIVFGSYMGGPKIGQGFYQNIIGNYNPLTMDIWWMRMWNRLVNRPLKPPPSPAELKRKRIQARNKLMELARGDGSNPDTALVRVVLGLDPFKFATKSGDFRGALADTGLTLSDLRKNDTFDQFVPAFNRAWNRYFTGYQSDNKRNPSKPQIFNIMGVLQDDIYGALQATPANGTERQYMREVTKRAQELLRETGVDIEIADLQALLWYPEKNLFEALGVKRKAGESTDYERAARILAKKGGYDEKQINEALSDTGSGTVDSGTTARRIDPRADYEAGERKFSRRRSDNVQRSGADRGAIDPSIRGESRADRGDPRLAYPVYDSGREGPEEGRSEYFGVHYTRQNELESLGGEFHGTGRAGLELKRGRRDRIYFYIQEDVDLPQAEQQLSRMPHGYGATLNNIYDVRKSRYIVEDVENRNQGIFNADMFEDMVVSEGYDGYINHSFKPTKAVVLLGKNNVPVVQVLRERNRVTAEEIFQERPEQAGDRGRRLSRRAITPLEGAPQVQGGSGPIPEIVQAAVNYAAQNDIPFGRQARYVEVDENLGTRISQAYAEMEDAPTDPKVREAYQSLIEQTEAQFQALEDAGYRFYFYDETNDPYDGNPFNAMRELRSNKTMAVFQTTPEGYGPEGTTFMVEANPLLKDSGRRWSFGSMDGPTQPVLVNDIFRAVHDTFGHGLEGAGFRARGEENAWQAHRKLYTGSAVGALTTETRGQNSYLNFGPNGVTNQTARIEDTVFAPQKIGLMPNFTWSEGVVEDRPRTAEEISSPELSDDTGRQKFSRKFSATASPAEFSDLAKQVIDSTQPDNLFDGFLRKLVGAAPGERVIDAFVRNNISRFEPGYKLDAEVYGSSYDNADSVGRSMELSQQLPGRIQAMLNLGPIQTDKDGNISQVSDPDVKPLKEIFRPLLEGLSKTEAQIAEANYYAYAVAKREKALRQARRKGLPAIDDALLDKTIANAPSFYDQIYNDYQKFNAYTVKFALDSGLLTQQMADEFAKMAYVPFYRTFNTAEGTTDFSSALPRRAANALTKPGALDKELLGSTLKIEGSLIDNLMENNTSIISSALRNIAMQKTGQALEKSNDPTWGEAVDPSKKGSNIMTYRVNGVEKAYKINDQPLWIAVSGLAPQQKDAYIKAAEVFSGILRTGVTSFPGFMLANLWRGKVDAYIKAGAPLDLLGTIPRMKDSIQAGQDTMDVKRITGFGGYGFGATPDQFGKSAARLIRTNGKLFGQDGLGIGDSARNLMDKINNFGEATEMEVRVALYQNLVNEGVPQREAAFQAMNLINYGRKGAGGGIIGSFVINRLLPAVPFLNARIQGLYRLVEDPRTPQNTRLDYIKAIMLRGTIVSAASVGLALMAMQDERWDEERLENKINYDIFYIGDTAIKLPRAFELGSIFGAIPVLIVDAIRKQEGDDLAKATGMILFNSFAFNPVSQVALPLLEVVTGYDTFRMAPLEGQGLQSRLDEDRFYATTPYFYRFLSSYGGRFVGLSPIEIQQLMEGYLAGFATFPVAFLDGLLSATGAVPKKPSGVFGDPYATDVGRALGLTRFFTVEGDQTSRFVQDFYTVRRDLDQLTKSIQDAADRNDTDRVNQLMARQDVPLGMRKVFNRAATQLTRINNELNAIMTSTTLSPAEKTEMMRKLRIEKNKFARQYVEAAKRASLI